MREGVNADAKYETYINNHIGIAYKVGANASRNLMDWRNKDVPPEDKEPAKDYAHVSADVVVGLPYMFSPVGYSVTGLAGVSARYSFSRLFSADLAYHYVDVGGTQSTSAAPASQYSTPDQVK